jgi:hypothetical protein
MAMSNEEIIFPDSAWARKSSSTKSGAKFRGAEARGPIIDQEGREIHPEALGAQTGAFHFDFGSSSANPFGNLTREQRMARLDALAKLLDVAFILPGTNIRWHRRPDRIDPCRRRPHHHSDLAVAGARARARRWHVTARMLGNVALDGVVGLVPIAGDAFDVMFRANIRNMRLLRRWMDKQRR